MAARWPGDSDVPGAGPFDLFRTEFGGITNFPFDSIDLSLLAVDSA